MKFVFGIFFLLVFFSCNPTPEKESKNLEARLDSLEKEIALLKSDDTPIVQKTAEQKDSENKPEIENKPKPTIPSSPKPEVKNPTETKDLSPAPAYSSNDTTFHKYINGKTSVKITPWTSGKRKLFFYNLYGEKTFELEDVRMSYTSITTLSFHSNGGVSKAEIRNNPGASRYWYETTITFSTTNDPILKYDRKMPPSHLDIEEEKPWFWIPNQQKWMKQEIVRETNSPPQK